MILIFRKADKMKKLSKIIKTNLKESYKVFKLNHDWYKQDIETDLKECKNLTSESFGEYGKKHYFDAIFPSNKIDFDLTPQEVFNIFKKYFELQNSI
jgi:hypothetical protein